MRDWFSRGSSPREGVQREPRRSSRNRRRPRFDGLEPRLLLSGNPSVREFPVSTPVSQPLGITRGPDGNVWFTESGPSSSPRIGRITPAGVVTGFAAGLTAERQPVGIAAGPDGNLWFTEPGVGRIGRITTTGVVTEFSAGLSPGSSPVGITLGPDGNLWFAEQDGNRIGRITPSGVITEFSAGIKASASPTEIRLGAEGNLWFTENSGHSIGRLDLSLTAAGTTINTTEGQPFIGTVATFTVAPRTLR